MDGELAQERQDDETYGSDLKELDRKRKRLSEERKLPLTILYFKSLMLIGFDSTARTIRVWVEISMGFTSEVGPVETSKFVQIIDEIAGNA